MWNRSELAWFSDTSGRPSDGYVPVRCALLFFLSLMSGAQVFLVESRIQNAILD